MSKLIGCWASVLGGCDKLSREHIISDTVIDKLEANKQIVMFGSPWNENMELRIGKSSFVSKILCKKHNSLLSELDTEAGKMADILNDIFLLLVDKKYEKIDKVVKLNGYLIERWFLKTTINRLHWHYPNLQAPSRELVEIVFGLRKYPENVGLASIQHSSGKFMMSEHLSGVIDMDILNKSNQPEIMAFSLWGWMFMLPLTINPIPESLSGMNISIPDRPGYSYLMDAVKSGRREYHPKGLGLTVTKVLKRKVIFEW